LSQRDTLSIPRPAPEHRPSGDPQVIFSTKHHPRSDGAQTGAADLHLACDTPPHGTTDLLRFAFPPAPWTSMHGVVVPFFPPRGNQQHLTEHSAEGPHKIGSIQPHRFQTAITVPD